MSGKCHDVISSQQAEVNSKKVKVIPGEGPSPYRQACRSFYNKKFTPTEVESLLVRPLQQSINIFKARRQQGVTRSYAEVVEGKQVAITNDFHHDKGRIFWAKNQNSACKSKYVKVDKTKPHNEVICNDNKTGTKGKGRNSQNAMAVHNQTNINSETIASSVQKGPGGNNEGKSIKRIPSIDAEVENNHCDTTTGCQKLIFDIKNTESDKFMNSIIYDDQNKIPSPIQCRAYDLWRVQSKVKFGFIPLTDPIMPSRVELSNIACNDPIQLHNEVKKYDLPNYLGAHIPVPSQLNICKWESLLQDYWDKQLLECLKFGFPLGFNRMCPLKHDKENHKSAILLPEDVNKYIEEERKFGAIIGPFQEQAIENLHYSLFMTRHKPNSENRRVILDLSWPRDESVNAGVDKNGYMGSEFKLTLPTIDDLTQELVKIGKGANIFKVDVSRAFRHLNLDPRDYDLLGINWGVMFIDTRIPFGRRHGSQFFQRNSET